MEKDAINKVNEELVAEELQTLDEVYGGAQQSEEVSDVITGMPYPW